MLRATGEARKYVSNGFIVQNFWFSLKLHYWNSIILLVVHYHDLSEIVLPTTFAIIVCSMYLGE